MFSHQIAKGLRFFPARLPPPMRAGPLHPLSNRCFGQHTLVVRRFQHQNYMRDKRIPEALEDDLVQRITWLERGYNTTLEDGLRSMKEELAKEFTKNLEKGLGATNATIDGSISWFRWIMATFALGMTAKLTVLDPRAADAELAKITESETKMTTMVVNTISQLKLQLLADAQERLLADKDEGGK